MRRAPAWLVAASVVLLGLLGPGGLPGAARQDIGTPTATARHPLVGTWEVVEEGDRSAAPGRIVFLSEGIVVVATPSGRIGLGSWTATGPRTAAGTVVYPGEIELGIAGNGVLRLALEVDATGAAFTADYSLTTVTARGNAVETSEGTVRGTRLAIEGSPAAGLPPATPGAATPPPVGTPRVGTPSAGGGPAATAAALEQTVVAMRAEQALLAARVGEMEASVAVLLESLLEQTALNGFLQDQVDDLRARVEALEAALGTPSPATPPATPAP